MGALIGADPQIGVTGSVPPSAMRYAIWPISRSLRKQVPRRIIPPATFPQHPVPQFRTLDRVYPALGRHLEYSFSSRDGQAGAAMHSGVGIEKVSCAIPSMCGIQPASSSLQRIRYGGSTALRNEGWP